ADAQRIGTGGHQPPTHLAAGIEAGIDLGAVGEFRSGVDSLCCFHLRAGEAGRVVGVTRAPYRLGVEPAPRGVFDDTVANAVKSVASIQRRAVNHRILAWRNVSG